MLISTKRKGRGYPYLPLEGKEKGRKKCGGKGEKGSDFAPPSYHREKGGGEVYLKY